MFASASQAACRTRTAEAGDLAGLLTLYRELRPRDPELPPQVARATFARMLARDDLRIVVCEADGALVSTCMLAMIPNLASGARPFGVIEHVVTLAAHRGHGFGRRVMEHALSIAWASDCCKVMLLSGAQRADAHRLYAALGFNGDVERGFVIKPATAASPR